MKVIFAGPSLYGTDVDRSGLVFLPPARQGDIAKAVLRGATAIGLIDGVFDQAAAVWHKEILYALSMGVRVLGAASMGALRAAECLPYGMEAVGSIAAMFITGELDDDAAVALTFGPAELNYCPVSEPLVDVMDKVQLLQRTCRITTADADAILKAARSLFYADRSLEALMDVAAGGDVQQASRWAELYRASGLSAKQRDAIALVASIRETVVRPPLVAWQMAEPPFWAQTLRQIAREVGEVVTIESRRF